MQYGLLAQARRLHVVHSLSSHRLHAQLSTGDDLTPTRFKGKPSETDGGCDVHIDALLSIGDKHLFRAGPGHCLEQRRICAHGAEILRNQSRNQLSGGEQLRAANPQIAIELMKSKLAAFATKVFDVTCVSTHECKRTSRQTATGTNLLLVTVISIVHETPFADGASVFALAKNLAHRKSSKQITPGAIENHHRNPLYDGI
ncbi:MAG: hypothetical protein ACD_23C00058G0002 [uncultured bacterium]|nr:MAG: hypothetical protein ACD_23C00058G0002 [uncultured bacterium]